MIRIPDKDKLWYFGSPYSKYPDGREAAFREICRISGKLVLSKYLLFSPIAHSHPISEYGNVDPLDYDLWIPFDKPMMERCDGLIVAKMDSWETSYGLDIEINEFTKMNKPIYFLDPADMTFC